VHFQHPKHRRHWTSRLPCLLALAAGAAAACNPPPLPSISGTPPAPAVVGLAVPYSITVSGGVPAGSPHNLLKASILSSSTLFGPYTVHGTFPFSGGGPSAFHTFTVANYAPGQFRWQGELTCTALVTGSTGPGGYGAYVTP
jgi:hypothetical protein